MRPWASDWLRNAQSAANLGRRIASKNDVIRSCSIAVLLLSLAMQTCAQQQPAKQGQQQSSQEQSQQQLPQNPEVAHTKTPPQNPGDSHLDDQCAPGHPQDCLRDLARDQRGLWTSPFRMKAHDLEWLLPLAGVTALAVHYDRQALDAVGKSQARVNFGTDASRIGASYTIVGTSALFYGIGHFGHHQRMRATGVRGLEAMADSLAIVEVFKLATERNRPTQTDAPPGVFWQGGFHKYNFDSSFPSGHSAETWAFAHVLSAEYGDKKWVGAIAYTLATTVSTARVMARKHFPSDVVVGGAIGYLTGGYVVRHRREEVRRRVGVAFMPIVDPMTGAVGGGLVLSLNPRDRASSGVLGR